MAIAPTPTNGPRADRLPRKGSGVDPMCVTRTRSGRLVLVAAVMISASGCAHRGVNPFVAAPHGLTVERGRPPACFAAPLAECVDEPASLDNEERFASRWAYPFHADVHHRVCRGDASARARLLDGIRSLGCTDGPECPQAAYLDLLGGCSSAGFCEWAAAVAADGEAGLGARHLLLEVVRRECRGVLADDRFRDLGRDLGRPLADQPLWTTSSQERRCATLQPTDSAWADLAARHGAGCLDLEDWLEDHGSDASEAASALERCINGREIRYREAECLRELAGLDRHRALALLRADDRRGWGRSSTLNRYARTLLRFPAAGELEARLETLGLLPSGWRTRPSSGPAAVLSEEILEQHGRLLRFNPGCPVRYCEHAPLLYRLTELASPELDELVIAERWPALEQVDFGSGSRAVSTSLRGIPVTFRVATDAIGSGHDPADLEHLRTEALKALEQPHAMTLYDRGRVYRLPVRQLGEWYDLEALLGGLNTVLADRGSTLRYATLEPQCIPCAQVVVGPMDGLIDAAFDGLIEVTDPFRELWTHSDFDPLRLTEPE